MLHCIGHSAKGSAAKVQYSLHPSKSTGLFLVGCQFAFLPCIVRKEVLSAKGQGPILLERQQRKKQMGVTVFSVSFGGGGNVRNNHKFEKVLDTSLPSSWTIIIMDYKKTIAGKMVFQGKKPKPWLYLFGIPNLFHLNKYKRGEKTN